MRIELQISPRMFGQMVIENLTNGDSSLFTDRMAGSVNRWLADGNNKNVFNTSDVDQAVDWVMECK
ncbi:MAG: hypothetical protein Unbinned3818contig1000_8 [Prokaryotic dsDNA virus sp.]|nr:MAG: hypothetical protein Unbinned3818contig1000_8 [Prokaryotic dsDNA virus sp.]|tara:strand:+ start:3158 stop:3355 length:198 start_codon:yes stop_codon:yes gene_type:complete